MSLSFDALDEALASAERHLDHDRYREALTEARQVEDTLAGAATEDSRVRVAFARALLAEGRAAERLGHTDEARAALNLVQETLRGDEPPRLRIEARVLEGILIGSDGDVDRARTLLVDAEVEATRHGYADLRGLSVLRQGIQHSWRGAHREALAAFDRAGVIELEADRPHRLPVMQNSLAITHMALGDLKLALEIFRDTLLTARAQGNLWVETVVLVNMAEVFYESGEYADALELYRQGLTAARQIGSERWEGDALAWIGQIYERLGQLDHAQEHLEAALEHHSKRGDEFQMTVATISLADVARAQGRLQEAVELAQHGLDGAARLSSAYLEARGRLAQAALDEARGDLASAEANYATAAQLAAAAEERRLEIWARRDLAMLRTDPEARVAALQEPLRLAQDHGFEADRVVLLRYRAQALESAGDLERALVAYRDVLEAQEVQYSRESDFRLRQQQVLYALEQAQHEADRHRTLAAELAAANRELERLATTDPLVHCANRREVLRRADAWTARDAQRLGVVMVDLDHFKEINDTHGHEAGDAVLVAAVAAMQAELRGEALLGRMGGEEFCVLLAEQDLSATVEVAERLRATLAKAPVAWGGVEVSVTASLGATAREGAEPFAEILRRADRALYRAKAEGRNRVASS